MSCVDTHHTESVSMCSSNAQKKEVKAVDSNIEHGCETRENGTNGTNGKWRE